MGSTPITRLRTNRLAKRTGWVLPSLALAILGGVTQGFLFGWFLYWGFNVIGVWTYCDSRGSANRTTQRWFKRLSMVLVPTGVLGLLAGGGGVSAVDAAHANSGDDGMLRAIAASGPASPGGAGSY